MEMLLTVSQVAERLDLHRTRIHALIKKGRLPAIRTGSVLLIEEADLALVAERKAGRPPKVKPEDDAPPAEVVAENVPVEPEPMKARKAKAK